MDGALADAALVDSGRDGALPDTGPADTGPADTGPADTGPADTGPGDPCATITCMAHARCVAGSCVCDTGFEVAGTDCVSPTIGDPATHTEAEVCARYRASQAVSTGYYIDGATMCDPGTLTLEGRDDAVRRLSFFRWLTGLAPVSAENATNNQQAQLCSVTSAWNPAGLSAHHPDPSAICYTPEGAAGAGSSNIAWGVQSGPSLIDMFMVDRGNDSTLGHRRWCLYPPLGEVGVGIHHGGSSYGGAACLKVIGTGGRVMGAPSPDIVPYPPAGFVPLALLSGIEWSLGHSGFRAAVTVSITRQSDGMALSTITVPLTGGYGSPTVAWRLDGWSPAAGEIYRVEVTDGMTTVTYDVSPVSC